MSHIIETTEDNSGWITARPVNMEALIGDNNGFVQVHKMPNGETFVGIHGYGNHEMELTEEQFEEFVDAVRHMFASVEMYGTN